MILTEPLGAGKIGGQCCGCCAGRLCSGHRRFTTCSVSLTWSRLLSRPAPDPYTVRDLYCNLHRWPGSPSLAYLTLTVVTGSPRNNRPSTSENP